MATKKTATAKPATNDKGVSPDGLKLRLSPMKKGTVRFTIKGTSPLVQHAWSSKAIGMMRDKGAGKKTKVRDKRDPEQEAKEATYWTDDGVEGVPVTALKAALITAAHKDIGIEKTLVKKAVHILCNDTKLCVPLKFKRKVTVEDPVRVGQGSADLRYRPYFYDWSATFDFLMDWELIQLPDLIALVNRAGFGVGLGEMRPECGKDFGMFEVDMEAPIDSVNFIE